MDFLKEADDLKVLERIQALVKYREESGVEKTWDRADRLLDTKPMNGFARDFSQRKVSLKSDDWQSDNSDLTAFTKVHVALSILAEQNPKAIFKPRRREFEPVSIFLSKLYENSLTREQFKYKLKRFIYNQGKYGISFGVTRYLNLENKGRDLVSAGEKEDYAESIVRRYNGPYFKPLSNWQVYWDDAAEIFDKWSMNDWCWYDFYTKSSLKEKYPNIDWTKVSEEKPGKNDGKNKNREDLVKLWYYENREADLEVMMAGDKVLDAFPIPTARHELSLCYAPWFLRDSKTLDCIGIPEILAQDKNLLDKIRNMSVDQLLLSIYKSFFYDGTNEEDGVLVISPGKGQQVLNPEKVKWLEVPGAGAEAYKREEMVRQNMDDLTFSKLLGGDQTAGKTAYETEQLKNAATRRLASPMDGLKFALENEVTQRMEIVKTVVTNSEVEAITDKNKQDAALSVYKAYPEIFHWSDDQKTLLMTKYPEERMKLKMVEKNGVRAYSKSDDDNFFLITPEGIRWEGDVEIDIKSTLISSPELEKQQLLELNNLLIPLMSGDPAINLKPVMMLLKKYDQDPADWLPAFWLDSSIPPPVPVEEGDGRSREANKVVPGSKVGPIKTVVNKLGRLFSKVNPKALSSK